MLLAVTIDLIVANLAVQLFKRRALGEGNMNRPIVLIHGYSDKGASFRTWREKLASGDPAWEIDTISTGNYQSLTDEVTIKDLADGLGRALRATFGNDWQALDPIVHSNRMLVI